MRRVWRICVVISGLFAGVFVIFGGMAVGYSLERVGWLAAAGAILGAMSAPELDPSAFRFPAIWQILFGVLGCVILARAVDASLEGYLLAVLVGTVAGYLAPYWVKHIQAP